VLEGRCQKPNPIARRSALRPSFYDSTFYRPISDRNNSQPLLVVVEPVIVSVSVFVGTYLSAGSRASWKCFVLTGGDICLRLSLEKFSFTVSIRSDPYAMIS
jgi:hypothetical protein